MATVTRGAAVSDPVRAVLNQPPPVQPANLFELDLALREALEREGGGWGIDLVREAGAVAGSVEASAHRRHGERNEPRLTTHDRYGNRIDAVELDPSWHWLLGGAVSRGIHSLPWRRPGPGAHVVRAAMFTLWSNANAGVMCPISMTYAAVPALRDGAPQLAHEWEPRLTLADYESGALAGWRSPSARGARTCAPIPCARSRPVTTATRCTAGLPAFLAECELAAGAEPRLDAHLAHVRRGLAELFGGGDGDGLERRLYDSQFGARRLVDQVLDQAPGAWSRTWHWPCRPRCSSATRREPSPTASVRAASAASAAACTGRCRRGSTPPTSSTAPCRRERLPS